MQAITLQPLYELTVLCGLGWELGHLSISVQGHSALHNVSLVPEPQLAPVSHVCPCSLRLPVALGETPVLTFRASCMVWSTHPGSVDGGNQLLILPPHPQPTRQPGRPMWAVHSR